MSVDHTNCCGGRGRLVRDYHTRPTFTKYSSRPTMPEIAGGHLIHMYLTDAWDGMYAGTICSIGSIGQGGRCAEVCGEYDN